MLGKLVKTGLRIVNADRPCDIQKGRGFHQIGTTPVVAMLFLCHGPVATYHIGWSGPKGRAMGAHNLILASAMEWLADRGHLWLDLGVLDTQANPGLARFKIGAGARVRPMGGTWLRLPHLSIRWQGRAAHARP